MLDCIIVARAFAEKEATLNTPAFALLRRAAGVNKKNEIDQAMIRFWRVYAKYKGNAKEIRPAKRAGNFGVCLCKMQRKYKGIPAREARRGFGG